MAMPCTCFISYPHVESEFFVDFVEELQKALQDRIRLLKRDASVILDFKRLKPGYIFDETISQAICRSVCMIVVYIPAYEESDYCLREFEAMERLQAARRLRLKRPELNDKGMIVPIIFRRGDLSKRIEGRYQYLDLSKVTHPAREFRGKKVSPKLDEIAEYIVSLYRAMENDEPAVCGDCDHFALPARLDVTPWRDVPRQEQSFPR